MLTSIIISTIVLFVGIGIGMYLEREQSEERAIKQIQQRSQLMANMGIDFHRPKDYTENGSI